MIRRCENGPEPTLLQDRMVLCPFVIFIFMTKSFEYIAICFLYIVYILFLLTIDIYSDLSSE